MAAASRYPSVMAVGNGQGQSVLVNLSPAVAHQLDRDPLLDRHPGLAFTAVATQPAPPPHLADSEPPKVGDSIALAVQDLGTGQRVCCAPGLARIGATGLDWLRGADRRLLDLPDRPHTGQDEPPWMAQRRQLSARHKVLFGPVLQAVGLLADLARGLPGRRPARRSRRPVLPWPVTG